MTRFGAVIRKRPLRPLFLTLFLSYLLFLVLPIVIIQVYFQSNVMHNVREQVSRSHLQALSIMQTDIEHIMSGLHQEVIKLNFSSELNTLNEMDLHNDPYDGEYVYKIKNVAGILSGIEALYEAVDSVYYINENQNCMISSKGDFLAPDGFCRAGRLDLPEELPTSFSLLYTALRPRNLLPSTPASLESMVTLIYPIRQFAIGHKEAIAINIPTKYLNARLNLENRSLAGSSFIVNEAGKIVIGGISEPYYSTLTMDDYTASILRSGLDEGYFEHRANGQHLIVTYINSELLPWAYVNIQPFDTIYGTVISMNVMLLIICAALFFLGLIFSYMISRRIYKPVAGIMETLRNRAESVRESGRNELVILSKVFDELVQNETELNQMIDRNENDRKSLTLLRVVNENVDDIAEAGLVHGSFVCILFSIDQYAAFLSSYDEEKQKQLRFVFFRACEEVAGGQADCTGISIGGGRICFLLDFNKRKVENIYEKIRFIAQGLQAELHAMDLFSVSIGVSEVYGDPRMIRASYQEAAEALQYRILYGHGSLIFHFQIQKRSGNLYYPFPLVNQIINFLKTDNETEIQRVLITLTDQIRHNENVSYDNVIYIFHQIIGEIASFMMQQHMNPSDVYGNNDLMFSGVAEKETLDELQGWIMQICSKLIRYRVSNEEAKEDYFQRITAVIRENYKRSDLDISFIATSLGLSYSYVRKKFAEYCDTSFVDYVNGHRVEEAKSLLVATNLGMEEIMERVGFSNYQSFSRVFKKSEGITPGKFRSVNADKKTGQDDS